METSPIRSVCQEPAGEISAKNYYPKAHSEVELEDTRRDLQKSGPRSGVWRPNAVIAGENAGCVKLPVDGILGGFL